MLAECERMMVIADRYETIMISILMAHVRPLVYSNSSSNRSCINCCY